MKLTFDLRGVVFMGLEFCISLRQIGLGTQGDTKYLWHRDNKKSGHNIKDKWIIYKRNKYDLSHKGDINGLARWVAAHPYALTKEREYKKL